MSSVNKKKQGYRKRKQGEFEVDKIIDKRVVGDGVQYRIKWRGFPMSESSWEPITNLISCQDIILEFEKKWKQTNKQKKIVHSSPSPPKTADKKQSKLSIQKQPAEKSNSNTKTQTSPKNNPVESDLRASRVSKIMNQAQVLRSSRVAKSPPQPAAPANYEKNKMAVSQVVPFVQPKKPDVVAEPVSVKRSLANHLRNQNQQQQQEITNNIKGRKMKKIGEKAPDQPAVEKDTEYQIAQRLIEKIQSKVKQKIEIRDKSIFQKDVEDKIATLKPTQLSVNKDREREINKTLKLEDDPNKQKKPIQKNIEKSKLYQSSVNQIAAQNTEPVATNQVSFTNIQQYQRDGYVFKHMQRYKCLDHYLNLHNRMSIKNIINKDKGGATERAKIKLVNVGDYKNVEGQLNLMKKITREISIEKLEIFVKLGDGWIAVGKNKTEGLFITDVNLLHESVWKVIEDMYKE